MIEYQRAKSLNTEPATAIGSNIEQDAIQRIQRFYVDDSIIVEELEISTSKRENDRYILDNSRVDMGMNTEPVQVYQKHKQNALINQPSEMEMIPISQRNLMKIYKDGSIKKQMSKTQSSF